MRRADDPETDSARLPNSSFSVFPLLRVVATSPRAFARLVRNALPTEPASAVRGGLVALAAIRIGLGVVSRARPGLALRSFGASSARSPKMEYVVRVFGIRAIAPGVGYLTTDGPARRR